MNYYPLSYVERHLNTFRKGGYIAGRFISKQRLECISFDTDTISFELNDYPDVWTARCFCFLYRKYVEMRYRWISHIYPPQWLININIPQGRCVLFGLLPFKRKGGGMKGLYVLNAYISMLFNLCSRCKNYIKLRACGICVGRHCVIHGHVGVNIAPSAKVSIGDNFTCQVVGIGIHFVAISKVSFMQGRMPAYA